MNGSWRSRASMALHDGRSSAVSRRGVMISGNSSATVGRRPRVLRFLLFFGCPRMNCPQSAVFPMSSHYLSDLFRMFDLAVYPKSLGVWGWGAGEGGLFPLPLLQQCIGLCCFNAVTNWLETFDLCVKLGLYADIFRSISGRDSQHRESLCRWLGSAHRRDAGLHNIRPGEGFAGHSTLCNSRLS